MAQAVFEEHPLEQYLRDAGEVYELMPGSSPEILQELDIDSHLYSDSHEPLEDDAEMEWRPQCLVVGLNAIETFLKSAKPSSPRNPFVERFKYHVISSSLLTTSLSNPSSTRSSIASIPGRLSHSRSPSLDLNTLKSDPTVFSYSSGNHYGLISVAAIATALFAGVGNRLLATLSLGGLSFVIYHLITSPDSPSHDFTPTFTALDDLISANTAWESTVQDTMHTLEKEDSAPAASPTTHALRVALLSTLTTTRTQCENVRQLFAALTCPAELAQLAEMYAPPSSPAVKSPLSLVETSPRPWSFPARRPDPSITPLAKRSTWHPATYANLANAAASASPKRRSHVAGLFAESPLQQQHGSSSSEPVTPSPLSPLPVYSLTQIAEDIKNSSTQPTGSVSPSSGVAEEEDTFGSAALGLQRARQAEGHATLSPPPDRYRTPRTRRLSTTLGSVSGSRHITNAHTTPQIPRHPYSAFTLHQSFQSAVSAKRYTCAHLLALRFGEDEEEYWENVRSMMELLTSTFADEAARLGEALEEVERMHLRDQNPTPDISGEFKFKDIGMPPSTPLHTTAARGGGLEWMGAHDRVVATATSAAGSFAPVPTHLSRFAAHVAAITAALEDAREHLQECVDALKEEVGSSSAPSPFSSAPSTLSKGRRRTLSTPFNPHAHGNENDSGDRVENSRAVQAYERLRRELGMALRECERGKGKLVDIVSPPPPLILSDDDEELSEGGVPGLGHDASDDSDGTKPDPVSPSEDEGEPASLVTLVAGAHDVPHDDLDLDEDDVAARLKREMEAALMQADQVYEADTGGVGAFTRERSKMTREERIRAMKARREAAAASGVGMTGGSSGSSADGLGMFQESSGVKGKGKSSEVWGPGGEVVQELKDVIWKVGEKRRRMQEMHVQQQVMSRQRGSAARRVAPVRSGEEEVDEEEGGEALPPLPDSPSPSSPARLAYEDGPPAMIGEGVYATS